jgi:hypothetical protein
MQGEQPSNLHATTAAAKEQQNQQPNNICDMGSGTLRCECMQCIMQCIMSAVLLCN